MSRKTLRTGPKQRSALAPEKKESLVAAVIRIPAVYEALRDAITVEDVRSIGPGFGLVYELVRNFHAEFGGLPTLELLRLDVTQALHENKDLLEPEQVEALDGFLDYAYGTPEFDDGQSDTAAWARKAAKLFLEERLADRIRDSVVGDGVVAADMPGLIAKFQGEAERLRTLAAGEVELAFPEGWDEVPRLIVRPTGISFFDEYMGGGAAGKEVYVLLGPFGSCKTTLAIQGVAESGMAEYAKWRGEGAELAKLREVGSEPVRRRGLAFYVFYEGDKREYQNRILSYAARIHRDSIKAMTGFDSLSTSESLKDYEREMQAKLLRAQGTAPGEQERAREALAWVNDHVVFIDMTGNSTDRAGRGTGYIDEIAQEISAVCRQRNAYPASVWIDYAGAAAKRHINAGLADRDHMRHLIGEVPLMAQAQIASPFDCYVVVLHQLSGEVQGRSPAVPMHHADSAESKSIGENANYCICVGNPTQDGLCVVNCSKHRRSQPMPPRVLRIEGHLNRVVDTEGRFEIDHALKRIVAAEDKNRVVAAPRGGAAKVRRSANPDD